MNKVEHCIQTYLCCCCLLDIYFCCIFSESENMKSRSERTKYTVMLLSIFRSFTIDTAADNVLLKCINKRTVKKNNSYFCSNIRKKWMSLGNF